MTEETDSLKRMLGDPRRAIISMSLPLFIGLLISSLQTFIDSFWCSGLGSSALASISISGTLYTVMVNVGNGMGVGASTAIARALGAGNKKRADSLASQAVLLSVFLSVAVSLVIFSISEPLLVYMGGVESLDMCMEYLIPCLLFSFPLTLYGIFQGTIRGEGAARKAMYMSAGAALLNMALDPLLIYVLVLGVMGASLATCVSFTTVVLVAACWYLGGRTHIRVTLGDMRFKRDELRDMFVVGVPQTAELVLLPLMMVPQNAFVMDVGGQDGIVCSSVPFRYVSLAAVVAQAFAAAMIPVSSAALGQGHYSKAVAGFRYTAKLCLAAGAVLSVAVFLLAEPLSYVFTYSEDMQRFQTEFVKVIRIYASVILARALINLGSGILQTLRFSTLSLFTMFLRECMFILFYWLAMSMNGVYWSLVAANFIGATIMTVCALYAIGRRRGEYPLAPNLC